jgi:sugar phosphate isomerase/epimerase
MGAGAATLFSFGRAQAMGSVAEEASNQKGQRRSTNMHVSLAAYSVRQALQSGEMDLFQFIDWCAKMELSGTELTSYYFEKGFDSSYLRRLRNRAFRNGLAISGTAIRNNFCLPPGPEKSDQIRAVKDWIDHAAELFAPHIRIFAGDVPAGVESSVAIQWVADGVRNVLDHAAERGVVVGLENHLGITSRAADLIAICEKVGEHPWFGVNLDTGNYHKNPYDEVALTAPWAVNVQVKVEVRDGDQLVLADLERVRDILVDSGYRGWVALEYEAEGDPFVEIPRYVARMKELFEPGSRS